MLSLIRRAFDIASHAVISLHTASLDVCKGQRVEIDESAYPFLKMFLDDVEIIQEVATVQQGQGLSVLTYQDKA